VTTIKLVLILPIACVLTSRLLYSLLYTHHADPAISKVIYAVLRGVKPTIFLLQTYEMADMISFLIIDQQLL
jgi:hypothetical protein